MGKKQILKKLWKNPRTHALMVMTIWIISLTLFAGIISLASFFAPKEEVVKEIKELTLEEKFNNLINSDYGFTYLITRNDEVIKYSGTLNRNIVEGYRERKDGIIKYKIENNITYEVKISEQEEIDNLYENINENMLDLNYIYKLISNLTSNKIKDGDREIYIYDTLLDDSRIKIEVDTNKERVSKILITLENESYNLEFS